MAKRGKDSKFALAVHRAVQRGTERAIDALKLFKLHKKQDKFALNYLRDYVPRRDFRRISSRIKQGKATVKIERKGYSFLISGRDLLPVLVSENLPADEINQTIENNFFREKYRDFSSRAWDVLPEYIGPLFAADKRIKRLLALSLFSPETKTVLVDLSDTSKRLVNHAKLLGETRAKSAKRKIKSADLNVRVKPARTGIFKKAMSTTSKVVHLREGDMDFLKKYINKAKDLEVDIPDKLKKRFRKAVFFELAKASARMELRSEVSEQDIERIRQLKL